LGRRFRQLGRDSSREKSASLTKLRLLGCHAKFRGRFRHSGWLRWDNPRTNRRAAAAVRLTRRAKSGANGARASPARNIAGRGSPTSVEGLPLAALAFSALPLLAIRAAADGAAHKRRNREPAVVGEGKPGLATRLIFSPTVSARGCVKLNSYLSVAKFLNVHLLFKSAFIAGCELGLHQLSAIFGGCDEYHRETSERTSADNHGCDHTGGRCLLHRVLRDMQPVRRGRQAFTRRKNQIAGGVYAGVANGRCHRPSVPEDLAPRAEGRRSLRSDDGRCTEPQRVRRVGCRLNRRPATPRCAKAFLA